MDGTSNPILVIHDSCSEGVWAVFTKETSDSAHVKNRVAKIIRGLKKSKTVIRRDQEPTIRSMERNDLEHLFEDDFGELCGCQVVIRWWSVGCKWNLGDRHSTSARTNLSDQTGLVDEHQSLS